jgi:hypothetical protein
MQAGAQATPIPSPPPMPLTADQLLGIARGFSRIFWGIGITLLILTNTIRVELVRPVLLPWHIIGLAIVVAGAAALRRAGPPSRAWARRATLLLAASLLQLYFVPFTIWWKDLPGVPWYTFNMYALIAVTLALLAASNGLVTEAGVVLGDRVLETKGRLCQVSVAFFILGPAFALLFYTLLMHLRAPEGVTIRIETSQYAWPFWMYFFALVPFLLTMGTAWDCKERCLRGLEACSANREG